MTAKYLRDAAAAGAVLGFFASSWYGWALGDPPTGWRWWLIAGAVASWLVTIGSGVIVWRHWSDGTVFDAATSRRFGAVVAGEFALAGLGAWGLTALGHAELVAPYIALVVGLHFFALAPLLHIPMLFVVALGITIGVPVALLVARGGTVAMSVTTGVVTGSILLLAAVASLVSMRLG